MAVFFVPGLKDTKKTRFQIVEFCLHIGRQYELLIIYYSDYPIVIRLVSYFPTMKITWRAILCFFLGFCPVLIDAQQETDEHILALWILHPKYTLPGQAHNYPGDGPDSGIDRLRRFKEAGPAVIYYGERPTERITELPWNREVPLDSFSIEMWFLNHVNHPVGALLQGKTPDDHRTRFLAGVYGKEFMFRLETESGIQELVGETDRGWKKYWHHFVATYDGNQLRLFLNGKKVQEKTVGTVSGLHSLSLDLELAGYFRQEPRMTISNLLKKVVIYDDVMSEEVVDEHFQSLQKYVDDGHFFSDTFHFNAGPYLHFPTRKSMNLSWETNHAAKATLKYGTGFPLEEIIKVEEVSYIHDVTIDNLREETPYYYEIEVVDPAGNRMSSGVLTFTTAPASNGPFSFCLIGDTESRPHINATLGEKMWEERPYFIMHLGDLTDGGQRDHKFEWNMEYFTGMTPVASRIPMVPVPGNGESDLFWYKSFHRLPGEEDYYRFDYGNAAFFMLNSNEPQELLQGGIQYEWLKDQLDTCAATWKFVAHHHCPLSSDENDYGNTWEGEGSTNGDPRFEDLMSLYETAGIDIVFYGHVHAYERTYPVREDMVDYDNGVIYIQSGGGGGNLEDFTPTPNWFSSKLQRGHHYCKVNIAGDKLFFQMIDLDGNLQDYFSLDKKGN